MAFSAPVTEQAFVLKHIVGIEALSQHERFADATPDMVHAIVEGIGAFAEGEFAPLNRIGDTVGARLKDGKVVMPEGFVAAYKAYVANGWGLDKRTVGVRRPGPAIFDGDCRVGFLGRGEHGICPVPDPVGWRDRSHQPPWVRPAKTTVLAKTINRRMVRHDEPD